MKVSSRHKRANQLILKRVGIIIGIIGLAWLFPMAASLVAHLVMTPVTAVSSWVRESNQIIPRTIRDRQTLLEEIQSLEHQLAMQEGSQVTTRRLVTENTELRNLLAASSSPRIAAGILARPNQLPYDVLQIDRGSDDGISIGAPVYRNESALLGIVERVLPRTSFVRLVTSPGFEISAYVSGSGVVAPMEGVGGGIARVRVPQGVLVQVGSVVILPGINTAVIGEVVSLVSEPTQPDQFAYVASPVSLRSLRFVSVGTEPLTVASTDEVVATASEVYNEWLISQDVIPLIATSTATTTDSNDTEESVLPSE